MAAVGVSVVVVAGGKSLRMGRDKAFVMLRGKPMIEHVLERVLPLAAHVLIIANRPADYAYLQLPVYPDVLPDKGALGGIYSALTHCPTEYALVVACDMPFLNTALLRRLISFCENTDTSSRPDVVVPVFDDRPQGLHAVYGKTCLEPIRVDLADGRLKVIGFYPRVRVRYVAPEEYADLDPDGQSFRNINTPEELRRAETES